MIIDDHDEEVSRLSPGKDNDTMIVMMRTTRGWLGRDGCPLVGTAAPPTQRAARPYRLHTGCTGCTLLGPPECLLDEPGSTSVYTMWL